MKNIALRALRILCVFVFVFKTGNSNLFSISVDEYGVVAQIAEPLVEAKITTFYISSCHLGNTLVRSDILIPFPRARTDPEKP